MDRSTFDQTALQSRADAMTGYAVEDGERVPVEEPLDFEAGVADGALISPVTDLTRLLQPLLGDGELDGTRLLEPETVRRMRTRQQHRMSTIDGQDRWYGHGLTIAEFLDGRLVGHGGLVRHAQAYAGGFPDRGLGVAVACNKSEVPMWAVAQGILATVAGESDRGHALAPASRRRRPGVSSMHHVAGGRDVSFVVAGAGAVAGGTAVGGNRPGFENGMNEPVNVRV